MLLSARVILRREVAVEEPRLALLQLTNEFIDTIGSGSRFPWFGLAGFSESANVAFSAIICYIGVSLNVVVFWVLLTLFALYLQNQVFYT